MDNAARNAVMELDRRLSERNGNDFSAATRWLAAYRDELAAIWRRSASETDRQRLAKVNAVLSVVVGGHYPLGEIPWGHIEQARDLLAETAS